MEQKVDGAVCEWAGDRRTASCRFAGPLLASKRWQTRRHVTQKVYLALRTPR